MCTISHRLAARYLFQLQRLDKRGLGGQSVNCKHLLWDSCVLSNAEHLPKCVTHCPGGFKNLQPPRYPKRDGIPAFFVFEFTENQEFSASHHAVMEAIEHNEFHTSSHTSSKLNIDGCCSPNCSLNSSKSVNCKSTGFGTSQIGSGAFAIEQKRHLSYFSYVCKCSYHTNSTQRHTS